MNCRPTNPHRSGVSGGFTLAEVLAALVFLAIVIPVAVEGVRIASRVGLVAERKASAARVADRLLNDLMITGEWQAGLPSGTVRDGANEFRWSMELDPWEFGALQLLTVQVFFLVQSHEYSVRLTTLADASAGMTATSSNNATSSARGAGGTSP